MVSSKLQRNQCISPKQLVRELLASQYRHPTIHKTNDSIFSTKRHPTLQFGVTTSPLPKPRPVDNTLNRTPPQTIQLGTIQFGILCHRNPATIRRTSGCSPGQMLELVYTNEYLSKDLFHSFNDPIRKCSNVWANRSDSRRLLRQNSWICSITITLDNGCALASRY